jgi:hypothetical protein
MHHRTPCSESVYDRARRFETHRTPCTESVYDRARRFGTHRTPCTYGATSRADKRCTPCSSTDTSPRARTAPSCNGLSSASSPASSPPLPPSPCPRFRHTRRVTLSRSAARSSSSSSSSLPRAPGTAYSRCRQQILLVSEVHETLVEVTIHQLSLDHHSCASLGPPKWPRRRPPVGHRGPESYSRDARDPAGAVGPPRCVPRGDPRRRTAR